MKSNQSSHSLKIKILIVLIFGSILTYILYDAKQKYHIEMQQAAHDKATQRAHLIAQQLEFRFRLFYQGLRTIARLPGIENLHKNHYKLNNAQRQSIQEIYNNLTNNLHLSEIYVLSKSFNPDNEVHSKPLITFEEAFTASKDQQLASSHSPEDEKFEYQQIYQQLHYFKQTHSYKPYEYALNYPALISHSVITCDRSKQKNLSDNLARKGIVYSVPYYDAYGKLQGVISGILLVSSIFSDIAPGQYRLLRDDSTIAISPGFSENIYDQKNIFTMDLDLHDKFGNWLLQGQLDAYNADEKDIQILLSGVTIITFLIIMYLISQDQNNKRLLSSEAKNRSIVQTAFDAIITINNKGIIESFNRSAENMFGYTASEIIGKNVSLLMPNAIATQHNHFMKLHIEKGAKNIIDRRREETGLRKNGEEFPLLLAVTNTLVDGKPFFIGIIADITELKQQQQEIELHRHHLEELVEEKTAEAIIAKNAAEKAYQAKSEFLANMSHELRTPMHTILSFAELGEKKYATAKSEKILQYFQRIHEGGIRQLELLNDLLDLSKLEAGKVVYKFSLVNIMDVINDQVAQHAALADQKHLRFIISSESNDTIAFFDHDKIAQVIRNLLSNAIKFSDHDTEIRIRIYPYLMKKDNQSIETLAVEIADTGIGIPYAELKHVFDKFVQSTNTKTSAGGTGLGLSICHEIIENHGGKIWADSDGETESRFTFCILRTES